MVVSDTPDTPDTPAAVAAHRVLKWLQAGELSSSEAAEGWAFSERTPDAEEAQLQFAIWARPLGAGRSWRQVGERRAVLEVLDDRGRPFLLRVVASADGTGRVVSFALMHKTPDDLVVRQATPADAAALRALEARVPVQHLQSTLRYDRPDPFAQLRLVDATPVFLVVEADGEIIAQHVDLHGTRRIGGADRRCVYRMRTRIAPEHQGRGVWPALNWVSGDHISDDDFERLVEISFIATGNEDVDDIMSGAQATRFWSAETHRLTFRTGSAAWTAGPASASRRGSRADASTVASLLAETHGHAEMVPAFTAGWLRDRLERSPNDYGWADLTLVGEAVVGVWSSGVELTVEDEAGAEVRRTALVADWGARGDAAELLLALRAAIHRAKETGTTHVSLFASPSSPLYAALAEHAVEIDRYRFWCRVPEPDDAASRGLYVDPLWF
jgi:hypothetical protein